MHLSNIWIYSKIKYFWNGCKVYRLIILFFFQIFTNLFDFGGLFQKIQIKNRKRKNRKCFCQKKNRRTEPAQPTGPRPAHLTLPRPLSPPPFYFSPQSLTGGAHHDVSDDVINLQPPAQESPPVPNPISNPNPAEFWGFLFSRSRLFKPHDLLCFSPLKP